MVGEEPETYLDHCEKIGDGTKNILGWWDIRDLSHAIQGFDGRVQR